MKERPLIILFYHLELGGVQRKIVDLVNNLGEQKPDLPVYVVVRRLRTDVFNFADQIKNPQARLIVSKNFFRQKWNLPTPPFSFLFLILGMVIYYRPRAILAFADFPSWVAVIGKIVRPRTRVVISVENYLFLLEKVHGLARLRNFLIRWLYPRADLIVTCNVFLRRHLIRRYHLPAKKIKVILNWTVIKQPKGKVKRDIDLLYLGRFTFQKRLDLLLRCFRRLLYYYPAKLWLVGEGKKEKMLRDLVRKWHLGKSVTFFPPQANVATVLKRARVLVFSSAFEGTPMAALEAMAMGVPVLSSNYPGAYTLIDEGKNGHLYSNCREFAKKAAMLLKNEKYWRRLSATAKYYAKTKYPGANMEGYLRVLGLKE